MEITKNTKVDWLLNYKAIKNQIQTADLALKTKINNRTSTLTYDMTNGFLSANYTLGGKTTYYNTANTLITNYTAVSDLSTALVTNMTDAAIDKQTEELEELIRILTGEIETLEADIKNLNSEYNSNYTKISNTSKGKSVSLSNYYITNAGGSITVTWTISDSTRNYALNSITSAYKDSSTGVITKKQAELDEYTTEKTKAENKIKEIAPEKSTYVPDGSGKDEYDDRGFKKNTGDESKDPTKTYDSNGNEKDSNETENSDKTKGDYNKDEGDGGNYITYNDKKYFLVGYTKDGRAVLFDDSWNGTGKNYVRNGNGELEEIKYEYKDKKNVYTIDGEEYLLSDKYNNCNTSAINYKTIPTQYDTGDKFNYNGDDYKVIGYTPDDGVKIYMDNDFLGDPQYYTYDESTGQMIKVEWTSDNPENILKYIVNGKQYSSHDTVDKNPKAN